MPAFNLTSLGNPGTFDLTDKSVPEYYIARLAHEVSVNLHNATLNTWYLDQPSQAEKQHAAQAYSILDDNFRDWLDDAISDLQQFGEIQHAMPTLPALDPSGIIHFSNPLLALIARIGINLILYWIKKRLEPGNDLTEVTEVLRKALLGDNGERLIEMMANTPLQIILSSFGDFQDFTYTDRPFEGE